MAVETQEKLTAPQSAAEAEGLDPNALAAIRTLIETQAEPAAPPVAARTVRQAQEVTAAHPAPPRAAPKAAPQQQAAPTQPEPQPQPQPYQTAAAAPRAPGLVARTRARITGYRPTVRHILLASLALLVLFRPWLVVGMVLMTIFTFVGLLLVLGYDGFWQRSMAIARWYARRRPSRAVELHRKLDSFAMKWDAVLDRFPEGTVDALYLPDFGELAVADKRHEEAMDRRLGKLREGEA